MELMQSDLLSHLDSFCDTSARYLYVIGGGKMAKAVVRGILATNLLLKENIVVTTRTENSAEVWRSDGFVALTTNSAAFRHYKDPRETQLHIVLLAVKPQNRFDVYKSLALLERPRGETFVISLLAGIQAQLIASELPFTAQVVRAMPNVGSAIGSGTTLLAGAKDGDQKFVDMAAELFAAVGSVSTIAETQMNAAAAISASGPAFIMTILEAIADGGVVAGLPRELATNLAASMIKGSGELVLATNQAPAQIKGDVCSPGGTTIAGVRVLEKKSVRSAFIEAILATVERSHELAG